MLKINNLVVKAEDLLPKSRAIIHPFYRDSFSNQYQISKELIVIEDTEYPIYNQDFLVPMLRSTLENTSVTPEYFFDIRTTEEYCQVAPEYALLVALELRNANPLGIKGMGALSLLFGFDLVEVYTKPDQPVLICLANFPQRIDCGMVNERSACSFLISQVLEKKDGEAVYISKYELDVRYNEVVSALSSFTGTYILKDTSEISGLTEPFELTSELLKKDDPFSIFVVLEHKNHWGYYIIERG